MNSQLSVNEVLHSFQLGLRDALRPQLALSSLVIGVLSAIMVAVGFAVGWEPLQLGIAALVQAGLVWVGLVPPLWLVSALRWLMTAMLFVLAVLLLMQLVLEFWLMPRVQKVCLLRHPQLQGVQAGTGFRHGVLDGARTLSTWLFGGLLCLLVPVVGSVLLLGLSCYLAVRSLVNDAVEGKATEAEVRHLIRHSRPQMLMLGALLAACALVPLAGLLLPALAGASTCHLMLARLERLRAAQATAPVGAALPS
ncbi:MAG: hypothetical protein C4K60_18480 [Ideonella sp. MAG2]|nr:MAG: hypothetical protein C4K60_18480 [Ideonella sp. MAG2]